MSSSYNSIIVGLERTEAPYLKLHSSGHRLGDGGLQQDRSPSRHVRSAVVQQAVAQPPSERLGRNLRHLINTVHDLTTRGVGFHVLTGHGASMNTATPEGKRVFGIFSALREFERGLVSESTKVGLASARASGRKGGAASTR
jgi:hypothetical protein